MESEEIIRAFLLEPGDLFRLGNVLFRVSKIENGQLYYHRYYPANIGQKVSGKAETMGANSREKLILITNKNKTK